MPRFPDLVSGFKMLREIDLNAVRNRAEEPFHIAVAGEAGSGKSTLINQLLSEPGVNQPALIRPISEHQIDEEISVHPYSIVILVIGASRPSHFPQKPILNKLRSYHVPIVICYNKVDLVDNKQALSNDAARWAGSAVVSISAIDRNTIMQNLVPAMLQIYKGREIALARNLPLFREPVSHKLIEDTCFINAAYSLTSGLAGINLLLTVPLNLADMVVLTKNQALMAYKIALAFDLPADWRQTIPKLATVVGTAFLWRTIARQLVGLVPVIGVVPKVAVAYAGTYAIGQAIYRWCANNEKVSPQTLKSLYFQALGRGKEVARSIANRRRHLLPN